VNDCEVSDETLAAGDVGPGLHRQRARADGRREQQATDRSGWRYAVAGVLAGIVPLTALALTLAMHRRGVLGTPDAEPVVTDEREPRPHY
jgi:anti-sigma-K factor RskA